MLFQRESIISANNAVMIRFHAMEPRLRFIDLNRRLREITRVAASELHSLRGTLIILSRLSTRFDNR